MWSNGHNSSNSTACLSELESNQFTFISTVSHNIRDSSELLLNRHDFPAASHS